ncbi:hypothetical protein ZIOFF_033387 [Zingiber officinale]|uniref:FAR1 domain-containing protein n=1 Tax=Zingiber officinale TaxID=94328 RepID=A0A8J5GJR1_ZINOF|nr:hypothetical protein ZIOFF_033387 [Zingiber officinale]
MEEGKFESNEMKDDTDHADQDLSPSTVEEVKLPEIGMIFSSKEEIRTFYNSYATSVGFGISKLGGRNGDDGKQKYFSIGCAKNRKKVSQAKNALHPRPSSKTNCKAKINVAVRNDGNFVITSVDLEHNHLLSPGKSRHFRCNKVLDSATKRKLELNDQAGITLSKSFHSCVVEAGGYENLSFDERKCRNYISEARRLRLGEGDAEALKVQQLGAESDEICSVLVEIMKNTKEKLIIAMQNGQSRAGQLEEVSTSGPKVIHSPLKVRTKGRPPTKRKQSKVEQIINKSIAKGRKEVLGITDLGLVPRKITKIGVVGGNSMGSDITTTLILKNYPVILKEVDENILNAGIDGVKAKEKRHKSNVRQHYLYSQVFLCILERKGRERHTNECIRQWKDRGCVPPNTSIHLAITNQHVRTASRVYNSTSTPACIDDDLSGPLCDSKRVICELLADAPLGCDAPSGLQIVAYLFHAHFENFVDGSLHGDWHGFGGMVAPRKGQRSWFCKNSLLFLLTELLLGRGEMRKEEAAGWSRRDEEGGGCWRRLLLGRGEMRKEAAAWPQRDEEGGSLLRRGEIPRGRELGHAEEFNARGRELRMKRREGQSASSRRDSKGKRVRARRGERIPPPASSDGSCTLTELAVVLVGSRRNFDGGFYIGSDGSSPSLSTPKTDSPGFQNPTRLLAS